NRGAKAAGRAQATLRTRICARAQPCPDTRGPGREGRGFCMARAGVRTARFSNAIDKNRTKMGQPTLRPTFPRVDTAHGIPSVTGYPRLVCGSVLILGEQHQTHTNM